MQIIYLKTQHGEGSSSLMPRDKAGLTESHTVITLIGPFGGTNETIIIKQL